MLPAHWSTPRLHIRDVTAADIPAIAEVLDDSAPLKSLDPTFGPAPRSEIEALIAKSQQSANTPQRDFQMQVFHTADRAQMVGYWHLMRVPDRDDAVGVSILLLHSQHRSHGYGTELVREASRRFNPDIREFWAQVPQVSNMTESGATVLSRQFAEAFADAWIAAWNAHDLARILSHYSDDFVMSSPRIPLVVGEDSGVLVGKAAIGAYWEKALALAPTLHFQRVAVFLGADSIVLHYLGMRGPAAEVFFFNAEGQVIRAAAHYVQGSSDNQ